MDAVKFIEERRRMCKATRRYSPIMLEGISPKDIVKEVEEWAAAHPRKTRQSEFLRLFPQAETNSKGVVCICPKKVDSECHCLAWDCGTCQEKYWLQEGK